MPGDSENGELDQYRRELIDLLGRYLLPFGAIAVLGQITRNAIVGLPQELTTSAPPVTVVALFVLHRLRARLPRVLHVGIVLALLGFVTLHGIWRFGIAAPALMFLPCTVLLAWLLLGRAAMIATAIALGSGYAGLAWLSVTGRHVAPIAGAAARSGAAGAAVWAQGGLMLALTTVLVVVVTRGLVDRLLEQSRRIAGERDRLGAVLDGIHEGVIVLSAVDGRIAHVNDRALALLGRARGEIAGRTPGEAGLPGAWRDLLLSPPAGAARAGGAVVELPGAGGRNFHAEVRETKLEDGPASRRLLSIRDVEEQTRQRTEIERMNADLEARVAERTATIERSREHLDAYAAAVSHDLRSPLRAIYSFAQILEQRAGPTLDEDGARALGQILAGAARMNELIDGLLRVARVDRADVKPAEVDMAAVVAGIVEEMRSAGESPPTCRYEIGKLPPAITDPALVRQVWANLIANACKFSAHREQPTIRVSALERPDGTWYEVADNGRGFDMTRAPRLFGMFQRLHDAGVDGLGIGLATVRRILDRLHGAIEVESAPEEGAVFRFRPGPARAAARPGPAA